VRSILFCSNQQSTFIKFLWISRLMFFQWSNLYGEYNIMVYNPVTSRSIVVIWRGRVNRAYRVLGTRYLKSHRSTGIRVQYCRRVVWHKTFRLRCSAFDREIDEPATAAAVYFAAVVRHIVTSGIRITSLLCSFTVDQYY
jgi:hypothetical protein